MNPLSRIPVATWMISSPTPDRLVSSGLVEGVSVLRLVCTGVRVVVSGSLTHHQPSRPPAHKSTRTREHTLILPAVVCTC